LEQWTVKLKFRYADNRECDHTPPSGSILLVVRASRLLREYYCLMDITTKVFREVIDKRSRGKGGVQLF
jgi:hypothetical protein